MAHYAELNENNEVIYVAYMDNHIITNSDGNEIEQLGIDHLQRHHGADRRWIRTSYSGSFRNKYAGVGDIYREDLDCFIYSQPYPSWSFDEETKQWNSPVNYPSDYNGFNYEWDEENQMWI